jgi:hypothetical protein
MPGLDKFGRPVGYGDGRTPSLADKVRLLQQLVRERQGMARSGDAVGDVRGFKKPAKGGSGGVAWRPDGKGSKFPVASINRPNGTGGMLAPVDPSRMPRGPIYPGPPLPNGKRYR